MSDPPVKAIVDRIVEAFHPRRIVMFGSRARGETGPDRDLDLFIEMDTHLGPVQRRREVARLFPHRDWAMDVVVYTPQEVRRLQDVVGTLLYTIQREGRALYEQQ